MNEPKKKTIRDIVDAILKNGNSYANSYAYALGATEAMLEEVLALFATPEQQEKWIQKNLERVLDRSKKWFEYARVAKWQTQGNFFEAETNLNIRVSKNAGVMEWQT